MRLNMYEFKLEALLCSKINNALYLSVNVFSSKALIGDTIFTFSLGQLEMGPLYILRLWPSSHAKV